MNDWLMERALLGEVPASRHAEVARAMDDSSFEARLDALRASNVQIFELLPPPRVAREVERRVRVAGAVSGHRIGARWATWLAPAAAAVAVVMFLLLRGGGVAPRDEDGIRVKGDARLEIYRRAGDTSERVRSGDTVKAGERLQLSYVAAGQRFGAILSIDGRGSVTLHYPDGPIAAKLSQRGATKLSFAYELDDAPNFERFVFITSDRAFDLGIPLAAAKRLTRDLDLARAAPLELPSGFAQRSYLLRKGASR